jgi:hypothetical protein
MIPTTSDNSAEYLDEGIINDAVKLAEESEEWAGSSEGDAWEGAISYIKKYFLSKEYKFESVIPNLLLFSRGYY